MVEAASLNELELISPVFFAQNGYPFDAWKRLRREAPVYWFDRLRGKPFWAITRYDDIVSISRQPERYLNAPRLVVSPEGVTDEQFPVRTLLNMDPPDHHEYRALTNRRFTPKAMQRIRQSVDSIAEAILDDIACDGEASEVDFVQAVSARLPIWVIAEMLGVPRSDWELLFGWTNRTIGAGDPEYREQGKTPLETMHEARLALFHYFSEMTEDRRKHPRDDLVSVLTHASVDGEPLPVFELMSYYFLLVVAGNETTRNATSGGLLALIEHPEQRELVRRDPALIEPLVEEILRWTSPVIHFCRTPVEDVELHGQRIRAGDSLCLFYPSANRDEAIFGDPDRFLVSRRPNRHIAFGFGEHVCLGAHVARLELQVMFRHMVERFDHLELAGPVERLRSSIVGGIKHMPIRYRLRPAAEAATA